MFSSPSLLPSEQVTELKLSLDGVERERDFYFSKLRDIEILCQTGAAADNKVRLATPGNRWRLSPTVSWSYMLAACGTEKCPNEPLILNPLYHCDCGMESVCRNNWQFRMARYATVPVGRRHRISDL